MAFLLVVVLLPSACRPTQSQILDSQPTDLPPELLSQDRWRRCSYHERPALPDEQFDRFSLSSLLDSFDRDFVALTTWKSDGSHSDIFVHLEIDPSSIIVRVPDEPLPHCRAQLDLTYNSVADGFHSEAPIGPRRLRDGTFSGVIPIDTALIDAGRLPSEVASKSWTMSRAQLRVSWYVSEAETIGRGSLFALFHRPDLDPGSESIAPLALCNIVPAEPPYYPLGEIR